MKTHPNPNHHANFCHHGRGPTSFWMQDPEVVFRELNLAEGDTFLDLGCGKGEYSLKALEYVGRAGLVIAMDKWHPPIKGLDLEVESLGITNLKTIQADMTEEIPLQEAGVDVVFLATVLHSMKGERHLPRVFKEIHRVLKKGGRLMIMECKKEDRQWGPPREMRLSPQEVEDLVTPHGFQKTILADIGFNYLLGFMPLKVHP